MFAGEHIQKQLAQRQLLLFVRKFSTYEECIFLLQCVGMEDMAIDSKGLGLEVLRAQVETVIISGVIDPERVTIITGEEYG